MGLLVGRLSALVLGVAASVVASALGQHAAAEPGAYMRVHGAAQPPYGFVLFCESFPGECASGGPGDSRMPASVERMAELQAVNNAINRAIEPATDMEIYGVSEHWTLPKRRGDCEDYALLKRKTLIARGWPIGSLLMTVVRDEKGEGHAILTARTTQGDFVLDNKIDEVKLWHKTSYEFVMRQSYVNARAWLSLDPRYGTPLATSSGTSDPVLRAISNLDR